MYSTLQHVNRANEKDKVILKNFNRNLIDDAELIERVTARKQKKLFSMGTSSVGKADEIKMSLLDKEAGVVFSLAKNSAKVGAIEASFFDNYVHDSLAGFNRAAIELTGYWRYRKGFIGRDVGGIVLAEPKRDDVEAA